jgi:hypothetical protein
MDKKELEARLHELKGKQATIMSQKKAERNLTDLAAVRTEMNDLKKKASNIYRGR